MSYLFTKGIEPSVNPTITAGAYSAEDVVGGLLTFDLSGLSNNGAWIQSAKLTEDGTAAAALRLYLMNALPASAIADNAAFARTDADMAAHVLEINFSSYDAKSSKGISESNTINHWFLTTTKKLYGYLVCTGTPTFGSTSALNVYLRVVGE